MITKVLIVVLLWGAVGAGLWTMKLKSERARVTDAIKEAKKAIKDEEKFEKTKTPLNSRLFGYSAKKAKAHWDLFIGDTRAVKAEKRFLEFDLVFPFLYGAALACTLLVVWDSTGRRFSAAWIMGLVALMMVGDWIENLVQMHQIQRAEDKQELSPGLIRIASFGTIVKLWAFLISLVGLALVLVGALLQRKGRSSN